MAVIHVDDSRWDSMNCAERIQSACHAAVTVTSLLPQNSCAHISLLLCNDARIRGLNRQFRRKDRPTDVLSFPSDGFRTPDHPNDLFLGDIALAFESCRRGASEASVSLADHIEHLVIHGCLHLLGFDHDTEENFRKMSYLETVALAKTRTYVP